MTMGARTTTSIAQIDARDPGFVDRVRDRIASSPDGLTRGELRDLFPPGWWNAVSQAVGLLIERWAVVEVTRVYPPGEQGRPAHRRIMALKSRSIRG